MAWTHGTRKMSSFGKGWMLAIALILCFVFPPLGIILLIITLLMWGC